jgi:hypothetical protein
MQFYFKWCEETTHFCSNMSLWSCWKSPCHVFTSLSCSLRETSILPVFCKCGEPCNVNILFVKTWITVRLEKNITFCNQRVQYRNNISLIFLIQNLTCILHCRAHHTCKKQGELTSPSENMREKWRHDRETSIGENWIPNL